MEHRAFIDLTNTLENQEARQAFEASLLSMKDSMKPLSANDRPTPSYFDWKAAVDKVWAAMDEPTNDGIHEYIERDYYFCTNPEK